MYVFVSVCLFTHFRVARNTSKPCFVSKEAHTLGPGVYKWEGISEHSQLFYLLKHKVFRFYGVYYCKLGLLTNNFCVCKYKPVLFVKANGHIGTQVVGQAHTCERTYVKVT